MQNYFKGNWAFTREVHNFPSVSSSFMLHGKAYFQDLAPYSKLYKEEGEYSLHQHTIPFSQEYLFKFSPSAKHPFRCQVLFPDGRLFYEITAPKQTMSHTCNKDLYQGHFEIIDDRQWCCGWNISGPRKQNITLITHYRLE
jgi:Family of unknown function (DUF6314)